MHSSKASRRLLFLTCTLLSALVSRSAIAGNVHITSPANGSVSGGQVSIAADASEDGPFHLEVWDNGNKLSDYFSSSVNFVSSFPQGPHATTVLAVTNDGRILDRGSVSYQVSSSTASQGVRFNSPVAGSTIVGPVTFSASATENGPFHLEIWDNGNKLGNYPGGGVSFASTLSGGRHTASVLAVSENGRVLDQSMVNYQVAVNAPTSPRDVTGPVNITSPAPGQTSINAVRIAASVNGRKPSRLEIWDNGYKLGNISSENVNGVYVLPNGSHTLTVSAFADDDSLLGKSSVDYNVGESCSSSNSVHCDLDQDGADNTQGDCNPPEENAWVANPCGPGIQGEGGAVPFNTGIEPVDESGALPNQGNLTLNGHSVHFIEKQGDAPSSVLFRGQSPITATSVDAHWTLDEYVYLPDPSAHQAFEVDAQYSINGLWTKFYTECAFNMMSGKGYWAVFDTETGGWIFLNGQTQNGQTPPVVPCNRNQFAQPWAGSGNPSFSGWHHIVWSFLRNDDGTVTYQNLTFDGDTTEINFHPNSQNGGSVINNGKFSALIQLDGVSNRDGQHPIVDAYVSEINLTHTP